MKKFLFLLLSAGLLIGCSDNNPAEEVSPIRKTETSWAGGEEPTNDEVARHDTINVGLYISEYPDLFGNVLVFDSLGQADALIEELSEYEYADLRTWYSRARYNNAVIESNIVYDSVFSAVEEQYGTEIDWDNFDENNPDDAETLDTLYERFGREMLENHPAECYWSEDSIGNLSVEPLGSISIEALCNEKHIFIADKVVYRYEAGYVISCPIDKYISLPLTANATRDEIDMLKYNISYGQFNNISDEDVVIYDISQMRAETDMDTPSHNYCFWSTSNDEKWKLRVYVTAYPVWVWYMGSAVRSKMKISNYYKGKSFRTSVNGTIAFMVSATCLVSEDSESLPVYFGQQHIDGTYRQRTRIHTDDLHFRCSTLHTSVTISDFNIDIHQDHGAHIIIN